MLSGVVVVYKKKKKNENNDDNRHPRSDMMFCCYCCVFFRFLIVSKTFPLGSNTDVFMYVCREECQCICAGFTFNVDDIKKQSFTLAGEFYIFVKKNVYN